MLKRQFLALSVGKWDEDAVNDAVEHGVALNNVEPLLTDTWTVTPGPGVRF